jgi:hypothetical protein
MHNPLAGCAARFDERYVEVDSGVHLRVLCWQPNEPSAAPLVFVAGWVSFVGDWVPVLRELVTTRPVYYLETREKPSAQIDRFWLRPRHFSVAQMADDVIAAVNRLNLLPQECVFAGSSLGATVLLEAFKHARLSPKAAFLIGPNSEFRFPKLGLWVLYLPAFLYHVVKYPVVWYLRTFRVDAHKEPEQMKRYRTTLLSARPNRIKMSARALMSYRVWSAIETIHTPVAIAHAPTDTLHHTGDIAQLVDRLPRSREIICPSNRYMHTEAVAEDIEHFFAERSLPPRFSDS